MKIEEVLAEITVAQHRLEVYKDIESYLEDYLPNDTGESPEVLTVSVACIKPTVAFSAIETVLIEISKLKAAEEKALKALNAMEASNGKSKPKPTKRGTTKSAKSTKQ